MAVTRGGTTKKPGTTDADIYFDIEDEKSREAFRQLFDNTRSLFAKVNELEKRVENNEQSIIDIEN